MSDAKSTRKIWQYVNKIAKARNADPNTVYLWAVKQVSPPAKMRIAKEYADELSEFWGTKGLGYTADREDVGGEAEVALSRGISSFSEEETEQIIRVLERVAFRYRISLLSPEENEKYASF